MTPESVMREIVIRAAGARLEGSLIIPAHATGIVAFAHGSGSSRFSPRNRFVAEVLHGAGMGTLLCDLLTETESRDRELVFDIPLLANRLLAAADWLALVPETRALSLGLFGASTGAAAAMVAAADRPQQVNAVVSRGGRPDLALNRLAEVTAPTLLIVGGEDHLVLALNRKAHHALNCERRLAIVPAATHLFEEPGALEEVAALASDWFQHHLGLTPAGVGSRSPAG